MNHLTQEINLLLNRKLTNFIKEPSNLPALYEKPTAVVVGDEQTRNKEIKDNNVSEFLKGKTTLVDCRIDVEESSSDEDISETEVDAVKNKRDFEIANNLEEVEMYKLSHVQLVNPDYKEHSNNATSSLDKTNKRNNANILPQMLGNNELRDSLILQEQQLRQCENEREQVKLQQQPMLSNFLGSDNDLTLEMSFEGWPTAYSKSQCKSKPIAQKKIKKISIRPKYDR